MGLMGSAPFKQTPGSPPSPRPRAEGWPRFGRGQGLVERHSRTDRTDRWSQLRRPHPLAPSPIAPPPTGRGGTPPNLRGTFRFGLSGRWRPLSRGKGGRWERGSGGEVSEAPSTTSGLTAYSLHQSSGSLTVNPANGQAG